MKTRGFTLIELLIVIAIIAILALIAIPNFLEAQTRAKVARAEADMRTIATGLESYFVDHNAYPPALFREPCDYSSWGFWLWFEKSMESAEGYQIDQLRRRCVALTTPIAYLSTRPPEDPFAVTADPYDRYSYYYLNFLNGAIAAQQCGASWNQPNPPTDAIAPTPVRFNGPGGPVVHTNYALVSAGPSMVWRFDSLGPYSQCRPLDAIRRQPWYDHITDGSCSTYDPTNGTVSLGHIWRLSGAGVD